MAATNDQAQTNPRILPGALWALILLPASLSARDWSSVPPTELVAQATRAIIAGGPPAVAAGILEAAASRKDVADQQMVAIAARIYATSNTTPLAVVRALFPKVKAAHRPRIAAALVAAAPACETRGITDVIRAIEHLPPPGIESTVRQVRLRAVAKE